MVTCGGENAKNGKCVKKGMHQKVWYKTKIILVRMIPQKKRQIKRVLESYQMLKR